MVKIILGMMLGVTIGTLGDIILAKGMKALGDIEVKKLSDIWGIIKKVVHTPQIPIAVLFMIACFINWMVVLSWGDLSLVLPMAAMSYVLNAILAKPLMGEHVSARRWVGTVIVFLGVVVVTLTGKA